MLSIIKYTFGNILVEALTKDMEGINPDNRIGRKILHKLSPFYVKTDVGEARETEAGAWASKIAKLRQQHADDIKAAAQKVGKNTVGDVSGTEAAGIVAKKGARAAGEAIGSAGKKLAELAGDHPGLVAGAAGLLGGALYMKRKRQQQ